MPRLKLLGCPGTGKTTRLMELLEEELKLNTRPDKIAFLTFTRAAREEALQRTGKTEGDFPFLRTIHAISYRQMNVTQDQIVRPTNLRAFGKFLGIKLNGNTADPWVEEFERSFEPPTRDDILLQINHCGRHRGILLKEALQEATFDIDYKYAVWFTNAYRNWKKTQGLLDYTDLLTMYLDQGKSLDIDTIFVDEAQDLSELQWEVVNKLGARAQRWFVAGDDDQAIFHWAGADSSLFQDLSSDVTEVLGQSYRLSKAIHATAVKISARIQHRLPKVYAPTESQGEVAGVGYLRALDFKEETFVLFRNHYRGNDLAHQLKQDNIPYIGHGSPLFNPDVRTALRAWYTLIKKGEVSSIAAKKIVKFSNSEYICTDIKRKLAEKQPLKMNEIFFRPPHWYEWGKVMNNLPGIDYIDACSRRVGFLNTAKPKVELLSIHQSKGREAHSVVLDTEFSRSVYEGMLANPDDEHRVWYVGATRAKERLFTLLGDGLYSYGI